MKGVRGSGFTVKVAPGARSNSPSPSGRGRGEGAAMATATFIFRGGAGAMAVSRDETSRVTRASRVTASASLRLCVRPLEESHAEAQRRREESRQSGYRESRSRRVLSCFGGDGQPLMAVSRDDATAGCEAPALRGGAGPHSGQYRSRPRRRLPSSGLACGTSKDTPPIRPHGRPFVFESIVSL